MKSTQSPHFDASGRDLISWQFAREITPDNGTVCHSVCPAKSDSLLYPHLELNAACAPDTAVTLALRRLDLGLSNTYLSDQNTAISPTDGFAARPRRKRHFMKKVVASIYFNGMVIPPFSEMCFGVAARRGLFIRPIRRERGSVLVDVRLVCLQNTLSLAPTAEQNQFNI